MSELLQWLGDLDEAAFLALNGWMHRSLSNDGEGFLRTLMVFGNPFVGLWVGALLIVTARRACPTMRRLADLGLSMAAVGIAVPQVKYLLDRDRPTTRLAEAFAEGRAFVGLGEPGRSNSFPSGHAATACALAVLFIWWATRMPRRWQRHLTAFVACVIAIGASLGRVYAGVHYPGDLLGGAVLGVGLTLLTILLFNAIDRRLGIGLWAPVPMPKIRRRRARARARDGAL